MMPNTVISKKAVAAFVFGVLSLFSGFMALASSSDLFLLGVPLFLVLALSFGIKSLLEIAHSPHRLDGRALAGWGMGIPVGGICLGFVLLPGI